MLPNSSNFISVGIPTYNSSKYLNECIESIITKKNVDQIIISDDGSAEDEVVKIENIINSQSNKSHKNIDFIRNRNNLGAFQNKLNLIEKSKNDFIYILDSDNIAGNNLDSIIAKILTSSNSKNYLYQPNKMYQFSKYSKIAKLMSKFKSKYLVQFLNEDTTLNIKDIKNSLILNSGSYNLEDFVDNTDDLKANINSDFLIDKWIFWVLNCGNFIVNKTKMVEIAEEGSNLDRKLLSIDAVVFSYLWLNSGNEIKIIEEFFHHHRKRSDSVSFIEKEDSLFATQYFIKSILEA
tara:strand:- start:4800 stop:5678 length:879 start_codon:yes stop_codon:yes gene_type:complete